MGDASPQREHLLCAVDAPEPTKTIADIKKKHPYLEVTYWQDTTKPIPDGKAAHPYFSPFFVTFNSCTTHTKPLQTFGRISPFFAPSLLFHSQIKCQI